MTAIRTCFVIDEETWHVFKFICKEENVFAKDKLKELVVNYVERRQETLK